MAPRPSRAEPEVEPARRRGAQASGRLRRSGPSRASRRALLLLTCALCSSGVVLGAAAQTVSRRAPGYAIEEDVEWGFSHSDRRVKAVLLAGSIGAYRRAPYARLLHERCANTEVRNLSKVAAGSYQLLRRFRDRVLRNRRIPRRGEGNPNEYWLIFQGGLNSAGGPERTNRYIRDLFVLAHRSGFRVLGLSLTPWGSPRDRRWRGIDALRSLRNTRRIVDFVNGRLTPRDALGRHRERRESGPDAPWAAEERADVAVDLYDSPLRHREAGPADEAEARRILQRDRRHRERLAALPEAQREARMERDVRALVEVRRWHMDPRYRSFDDVHPNEAGHRVIADRICPRLPPSWGCACAEAEGAADPSRNTPR